MKPACRDCAFAADHVISTAREANLEPDRIVADDDGSVSLYFFARPVARQRFVVVGCDSDGSIGILFVDRLEHEQQTVEIEATGGVRDHIEKIARWCQ